MTNEIKPEFTYKMFILEMKGVELLDKIFGKFVLASEHEVMSNDRKHKYRLLSTEDQNRAKDKCDIMELLEEDSSAGKICRLGDNLILIPSNYLTVPTIPEGI